MIETYIKLWNLLIKREKKQALFLIILMITYGAIEMIGIVSIFPLVAVLSDPKTIKSNVYLNSLYQYLDFQSIDNFLIFLTSIVFFVTIFRILFNGFVNHNILRFTQMRNKSFSSRLLNSYLKKPYIYFLGRHSADMGKTILSEVEDVISGSLIPAIELASRSIISFFVIIAILIASPSIAATSIVVLSFIYGLMYLLLRKYLLRKGFERVEANRNRFMIAQEVLVGIKEIKVRNATNAYLDNFNRVTNLFHQLRINTSLAKLIPQLFIQISASGGVLLIILVLLIKQENYSEVIPIVALYAFAGMRILPIIQGIFKSLTSLRGSKAVLSNIYEDLVIKQKISEKNHDFSIKSFRKNIVIENLTFSYPNSKLPVINNLSLKIPAKTSVAFVGPTGAGKTTTIDLILGLLEPDNGSIKIDGFSLHKKNIKSWQKIIGYVPQTIFISDDSIAKNIALGFEQKDIDYERIKYVAKLANLDNFILKELQYGYETKVGEAGVKLSGGQRQRLGIARALYLNPQVLIFDEATSSLDNLTEKAIMKAINQIKKSITVIMIAHRLTTIKDCDTIFLLENGKLKSQGNFNDLALNDDLFRKMTSNLI